METKSLTDLRQAINELLMRWQNLQYGYATHDEFVDAVLEDYRPKFDTLEEALEHLKTDNFLEDEFLISLKTIDLTGQYI